MSLTTLLLLVFVPHVLFLGGYFLARPWWKSWEGSALVTSSTGWALVSGGFLLDLHFIDVPDEVWIAFTVVAAVAAWLKLWILVHARLDVRAERRRQVDRHPVH